MATPRQEIILLGSAGQRIITAGELVCLAGMAAGFNASQKNDYPITVLRGHSISEMIVSADPIGFTGIERPDTVLALAQEGVGRRKGQIAQLGEKALVIRASDVALPETAAEVRTVDFKALSVKGQDRALAALTLLAAMDRGLTLPMLRAAVNRRFSGKPLEGSRALMDRLTEKSPA